MRMRMILAAGVLLTALMTFPSYAGNWIFEAGAGWRWKEDDGTYPMNTWKWIDGDGDCRAECYYFDRNGYMAANQYVGDGYEVNTQGAWVEDGVVQEKIVAFQGTVIGSEDYIITLPDSWKGNFYIDQTEESLRVYFYPVNGNVREIFEVHRVGSLEAKKILTAQMENKKDLGWCRGNYYICGLPQEQSLAGYNPGEKEMIRQMTKDYEKNIGKYFEFQ